MQPYYSDDSITLYNGDCREVLRALPAESVHCCVTSPPFFHLRDYGVEGQIGLEPTLPEYIAEMVGVLREVRRVLRKDGTLWLEIGDCYSGGRGGGWKGDEHGQQRKLPVTDLGPKQLMGVPWRLAFALQDDGWILRQEIVWHKPNAMPESVQDRPTRVHSTMFLLARAERYYYDNTAIAEPMLRPEDADGTIVFGGRNKALAQTGNPARDRMNGKPWISDKVTRNRRSVWTIPTTPYSEAHFACFPPALIEPCILAGTSKRCCPTCGQSWVRVASRQREAKEETSDRTKAASLGRTHRQFSGGFAPTVTLEAGWRQDCACPPAEPVPAVVLDPFFGSGTTGEVAVKHNRRAIGVELNPDYCAMSVRRFDKTQRTLPLVASE